MPVASNMPITTITVDTRKPLVAIRPYHKWSKLITAVQNYSGSLYELLQQGKEVTLKTPYQCYNISLNDTGQLQIKSTRIYHAGLFGKIKNIIFSMTHQSNDKSLLGRERIIKACIEKTIHTQNSSPVVCRNLPGHVNELAQMDNVNIPHDDLRHDVIKHVQEKNIEKYSEEVISFAKKFKIDDFNSIRVVIDILKENGDGIPFDINGIYFHRTVKREFINEFDKTITNNKGAVAYINYDNQLELELPTLPKVMYNIIHNISISDKNKYSCDQLIKEFVIKRLCEERVHIVKGKNKEIYLVKNSVISPERLKEKDLIINIKSKEINITPEDLLKKDINYVSVINDINDIIFNKARMNETDKEKILPLINGFNKSKLSTGKWQRAYGLPHGGLNFLVSSHQQLINLYHKPHNALIRCTLADILKCGGRIYKDIWAADRRAVIVELPQNAKLKFNS